MKLMFVFFVISTYGLTFGQNELCNQLNKGISMLSEQKFRVAYNIFKDIEPKMSIQDTLYPKFMWYYTSSITQIEKAFRENQQFDSSLYFALHALQIIDKGKPLFDAKYAYRTCYMTKNIIVAYFGMGEIEKAKKYKAKLYKAKKENKLPEGLSEYFNFNYFKWEDKNIWGYEWFEELPKERISQSFTKIVYYVYSTNFDGTDKEQLYRLHVLMFHKFDSSVNFDYVLTKIISDGDTEISKTLYDYTYTKDIDYTKLKSDIIEVLKGEK